MASQDARQAADEQLLILRLVDEGRITPEQAVTLLRELQPELAPDPRAAQDGVRQPWPAGGRAAGLAVADRRQAGAADGPQWLRLRVADRHGRPAVDVRLPLSIVGVGLRIGARWVPQLRVLDPSAVVALLRLRPGRPVFTFQDPEGGDRVEIVVE
jgi:hypothetical protein